MSSIYIWMIVIIVITSITVFNMYRDSKKMPCLEHEKESEELVFKKAKFIILSMILATSMTFISNIIFPDFFCNQELLPLIFLLF